MSGSLAFSRLSRRIRRAAREHGLIDSDVTATPNYVIGILDPAAPDFFGRQVTTQFPANVYEPSKVSRDQSIDFFNSIGLNHELSRRLEPTRSTSTRREFRPAVC